MAMYFTSSSLVAMSVVLPVMYSMGMEYVRTVRCNLQIAMDEIFAPLPCDK